MRLFVFSIALLATTGCQRIREKLDPCSNDEIRRDVSPDGKHEAVVFSRSCGATTGYSPQVSVVETGTPVVGNGNAFAGDERYPAYIYVPSWTSNTALTISSPPGASSSAEEIDGVRVTVVTR